MFFPISLPAILLVLCQISLSTSTLQFELEVDKFKCFYEELFKGSVMMIKWKVSGLVEPDEQKATMFLAMINLSVIGEKNHELYKREPFRTTKGKLTFNSNEEATYKVCVTYHGGWTIPYPVLVGLKISSDNMDEPNIKDAIKTTDVDVLHQKTKTVLETGRNLIERQKGETDDEENVAFNMMRYSKTYYKIAVFQILVVLALGVYQVVRFRKFLINHDFI